MSDDTPQAARFPLGDALGLEVKILEPGTAEATIATSQEHHNPHGVVHGAVLFALADTAMGGATMSVLGPEEWCASIEVHLRFLRPVLSGVVRAMTTVVHRGRRIVQLDSQLTDDEGRLVATATGSFAVIPRPS